MDGVYGASIRCCHLFILWPGICTVPLHRETCPEYARRKKSEGEAGIRSYQVSIRRLCLLVCHRIKNHHSPYKFPLERPPSKWQTTVKSVQQEREGPDQGLRKKENWKNGEKDSKYEENSTKQNDNPREDEGWHLPSVHRREIANFSSF